MRCRWVLLLLVLPSFTNSSFAAVIDISGSPTASAMIDGAIYEVFDAKTAGTGAIDSFLRLQATGQETVQQGYNTGFPRNNFPSGFPDFQQKKGNFTYNITLGDVPIVNEGGIDYRALLLDLNEPNGGGADTITLERLQIYVGPDDNVFINGDEGQLVDGGPFGTKAYDLDDNGNPMPPDNEVLMADMFSGSGTSDVRILIPDVNFTGVAAADYFTVFAEFSNFAGGFEEFVAQGAGGGPGPGGDPTPGPDPGPGALVPEPGSYLIWLLVGGVAMAIAMRRRYFRRVFVAV